MHDETKVIGIPQFFLYIFHERGRRVGGVPRSSLKGKETLHDEGEKNTSDPKQQKPTNPNHKPKTSTARGRFPLIKARFLCTRVRRAKMTKADC